MIARPPDDLAVPGWSTARLRILAAVAETFAPGADAEAYPRRARLAAEVLNAEADALDLRLLKLVVTSLDWRWLNRLLGGRAVRFRDLDATGRDALFLRWATSRIGRRRSAFQALKRLSMFLAWTDPGSERAANRDWEAIAYRPPPPVTPSPPTVAPIQVRRDGAAPPLELEADVVVVGSGAGGGVVAARIASEGGQVVVVEAGPYLPEAAMPTLERDAYQRLYLDQGTTSTRDLAITILAGAGLGGGTVINWTTAFAPPPWLRDEWATVHGLQGFDGPETDADIARLVYELGIRAPTWIPPKDQVIINGAGALRWEAAPTERNAGPCIDCGGCSFGCRLGAKRSGLRTHLASAMAAGARILVEAPVSRVDFVRGKVSGVSGRLRGGGAAERPFRIRAPQVVVAAGALRSPLLLEASGVRHPDLGRHLRLHPVVSVGAVMPYLVDMWIGPSQAARTLEFVHPGPAAPSGLGPAHHGFVIESAPAHPGLLASGLPWEGGAATRALLHRSRNLAPLVALVRDTEGGRVWRGRSGHPQIEYLLTPADRNTAARALVEMSRLARAAGADEIIAVATPPHRIRPRLASSEEWTAYLERLASADLGPNRTSLFSAHQMGTVRAGDDPRLHPCDPHGRVRSGPRGAVVPGLYVGDGSLLPSAPGVNPMVTIMLMAERTARAVLADVPSVGRQQG